MNQDFTQLLNALEQGDPHAAEALLPLVCHELRKLAAQRMAQEQRGQTLQPTALVHEAYLRLVGQGDPGWANALSVTAAMREFSNPVYTESRPGLIGG